MSIEVCEQQAETIRILAEVVASQVPFVMYPTPTGANMADCERASDAIEALNANAAARDSVANAINGVTNGQ